jgi:hypothetical protein
MHPPFVDAAEKVEGIRISLSRVRKGEESDGRPDEIEKLKTMGRSH